VPAKKTAKKRKHGLKCEHGRPRHLCKECGGSGICEHGRVRSRCKDCRCAREGRSGYAGEGSGCARGRTGGRDSSASASGCASGGM
jgi:hypothetical protein